MAINKPTKPSVSLPDSFGGIKTPYTDSQIESGYEDGIPQIVDGGNINYEKDATFQKMKYIESVADVINGIPAGYYLGVDSNNKFQYYDASIRNSYGNVGDIKYTMRTDVPYGGAWCDGTMYTKAQLPDLYDMLVAGDLQVITIDQYNAKITANGVCGYFGLDTENERFKVPTIKDVYIKVGNSTSVPDFVAESLPNIKGDFAVRAGTDANYPNEWNGVFLYKGRGENANSIQQSASATPSVIVGINASRSSSTYKDNAKVNPDHVTYRAYVVLYSSAAEASVAQVAEFMTALSSKQDIATAVNYDNITNCITKIPQDIKLELADGVLTLKAGSKVYVPNGKNTDGSNKFDAVVLSADKEFTFNNYSNNYMLFYQFTNSLTNGNTRYFSNNNAVFSGTTAPTTDNNLAYLIWYDTANNLIKESQDGGTTWFTDRKFSLPFSLVTTNNGAVTSIDQVFNGFGYIGGTIFALPGVKGLIPNGRNADGSLKNIEIETTSVATETRTNWGSYTRIFHLRDDYKILSFVYANAVYDSVKNIVYNKTLPTDNVGCFCGEFVTVDGVITSFTPKTAFHALDYNDLENVVDDFNNKFQVVSAVPANPVTGTFYYIPE